MYDQSNDYYYIPTEEIKSGSSHTFTGDNSIFKLTKTKYNGKLKTRLGNEVSTSVESEFYISERQKINTGRLKPMIKPLDSGWSYILDLSLKLISLLVIWSYNCSNATKKKVTHLGSSIVQVLQSTLNIIPRWISKPQIKKSIKHQKASSGARRLALNLRICKNSHYDVRNCKSGKHN